VRLARHGTPNKGGAETHVASIFRRRPDPAGDTPATPTVAEARTAPSRHDFGDGLVAARQHRNPDGSLGGWVADTAHVDDTVFVGAAATVSGNARVFGVVIIADTAAVRGNARVDDAAVIKDRAVVTGNSKVSNSCIFDDAVVSGEARVAGESLVGQRSRVDGEARVIGPAHLYDQAHVTGRAWVSGGEIRGTARVDGSSVVRAGMTIGERPLDAPAPTATVADRLADEGGDEGALDIDDFDDGFDVELEPEDTHDGDDLDEDELDDDLEADGLASEVLDAMAGGADEDDLDDDDEDDHEVDGAMAGAHVA